MKRCRACDLEFLHATTCPDCGSIDVAVIEARGEVPSGPIPGSADFSAVIEDLSSDTNTSVRPDFPLPFRFGGKPDRGGLYIEPMATRYSDDESTPLDSVGGVVEQPSPPSTPDGANPPKMAKVVSVDATTIPSAKVVSISGDGAPNESEPSASTFHPGTFMGQDSQIVDDEIFAETEPIVIEQYDDLTRTEFVVDLDEMERLAEHSTSRVFEPARQYPAQILPVDLATDAELRLTFDRALSDLEEGRAEEAASLMIRITQRRPDVPPLLNDLGVALLADAMSRDESDLLRSKRFDQAVRALRRAAELDVSNTIILSNLATVYAESGDHERAHRVWDVVVRNAPELAAAHNGLAISAVALGDRAMAKRSLDRANEIDPSSNVLKMNRESLALG